MMSNLNDKHAISLLFERYQNLLSVSQRQVLALFLYEDLSFSEIANELALTRQAAHDAYKKGVQKLQKLAEKLRN